MNTTCDVIVVGAGLSGLTAAFRLAQTGFSVEVVEAASRAGGVIGTETRDGFLYECGPNSMLDSAPVLGELLADLGLSGQRVNVSGRAKNRFIAKGSALIPLPLSPSSLMFTRLFSTNAKLRVMTEPLVPRAPNPAETMSGFVTRRLGREFLDYAIEPFVAGIFAGNPDELSVKAAFPRMYALEERYGGLIRGQFLGARDRARERGGRGVATSFSFVHGMQTLTDALARAAAKIRLNTRATSITTAEDGVIAVRIDNIQGTSELRARAVILATAADSAAALVESADATASAALNAIPYAPVASVALGYARADIVHRLDGFGFLVPRAEKRRVLGCLFSSTMFVGRAPEDHVLVTVYIGGRRNPELVLMSEDDLVAIAHEELHTLLGARNPPRFSAVTRWQRAIPQYTVGHLERIAEAERAQQALPGLFLCASYRGGISVGDCIQSGYGVADAVRDRLRTQERT